MGYSPWGHKGLDMTERLTFSLSEKAQPALRFWSVQQDRPAITDQKLTSSTSLPDEVCVSNSYMSSHRFIFLSCHLRTIDSLDCQLSQSVDRSKIVSLTTSGSFYFCLSLHPLASPLQVLFFPTPVVWMVPEEMPPYEFINHYVAPITFFL